MGSCREVYCRHGGHVRGCVTVAVGTYFVFFDHFGLWAVSMRPMVRFVPARYLPDKPHGRRLVMRHHLIVQPCTSFWNGDVCLIFVMIRLVVVSLAVCICLSSVVGMHKLFHLAC